MTNPTNSKTLIRGAFFISLPSNFLIKGKKFEDDWVDL